MYEYIINGIIAIDFYVLYGYNIYTVYITTYYDTPTRPVCTSRRLGILAISLRSDAAMRHWMCLAICIEVKCW